MVIARGRLGWEESGRKHKRALEPWGDSPEVSGQGLCTQVRRLGLSRAPGSACDAKARSDVRRTRSREGRSASPTSPAPAPESGPLDGAEPDCPSKEPHPHPTFRAAVCFRPSAWITGLLLGVESALADGG